MRNSFGNAATPKVIVDRVCTREGRNGSRSRAMAEPRPILSRVREARGLIYRGWMTMAHGNRDIQAALSVLSRCTEFCSPLVAYSENIVPRTIPRRIIAQIRTHCTLFQFQPLIHHPLNVSTSPIASIGSIDFDKRGTSCVCVYLAFS